MRWVSVKEKGKLPKNGEEVLVLTSFENITVSYLRTYCKSNCYDCSYDDDTGESRDCKKQEKSISEVWNGFDNVYNSIGNVTHWMPRPELPGERELNI